MKTILITGISGTGKSTLSLALAEKGYTAYDLEEIDGLFSMFDKETGEQMFEWDNDNLEVVKKMNWLCDTQKLKTHMSNQTAEFVFYCGAGSNIEAIAPFFDAVVLLTANEETIRHRISTRTSNDYGKVKGVQDIIIQNKDNYEEVFKEKGAIVVDANKNLDEVVAEVIEKTTAFLR